MGGLTSAVHWWEEWQLRVLVLASLFVQFLLLVFSFFRSCAIPRWCRFILWLAYLAGDAVAIYALATLFNRHKEANQDGGGGTSSTLEVVWAPVLLLHLGGHDGITAYNIEDNELWSRHLLTAVSQVTVAVYVFGKSWPRGGDKRLLVAAILLFVPGIVKCFHKPLALKRASIYSLVSSAAAAKKRSEGEMLYPLEQYVTRAKDFASAFVPEQQHRDAGGEAEGASEPVDSPILRRFRYLSFAFLCVEDDRTQERRRREREERRKIIREERRKFIEESGEVFKLFVDLSSPYPLRLSILQHFWGLDGERAHGSVKRGLSTAFMLLYTKKKTAGVFFQRGGLERQENWCDRLIFMCCQCILLPRWYLPSAAIGTFTLVYKEAYAHTDVKITYALFCCTAALEFYSAVLIFSPLSEVWPEMVAQYSLIGYFARNKRRSKLMWIVSLFDQQHWFTSSSSSARTITKLVLGYLRDGWTKEIKDAGTYLRFNDHSSHWVLLRNHHSQGRQGLMRKPFDESVLLWHLVTDFCFFSSSSSEHEHRDAFDGVSKDILCRQMSNYMVYLLFINPEMLLPGSRRNLFIVAHEELETIFEDEKPPLKKRELVQNIIGKISSQVPPAESTLIHDAWMIAQDLKLRHNNNNNAMWEEIKDVWVEMLCFSASRCRGFLHAKALGQGGEFLSYVWLLLFHMGMETFTDKLQRTTEEEHPIIPSRDQNNGSAPLTTTGTAPSTSEVRIDLDPIA